MKKKLSMLICLVILKVGAQTPTLTLADSLYRIGNYSKAIEAYENNASSYAKIQIARAYVALGNSKKAIAFYEEGLAIDSSSVLAKYDYGKLLLTKGKAKKAMKIYRDLIQEDSLNPNFHYQLGLAKEQASDSTYISSYTDAFDLDSQHQKSIHKLTKFYLGKGKFKKTKALLTQGFKNNEDDIKLIGFQAQWYYLQAEYTKALLWFEKLIDRKKATDYVYEKAAFAAYKVHAFNRSIELYNRLAQKNKENYYYQSQLAKLYLHKEKYKKAQMHTMMSLFLKRVDTYEDYYILGIVHFEEKKHKLAIQMFKKALKEKPYYEKAQFQLALCCDAYYADLNEKLKGYEKFVKTYPDAHKDRMALVKARISELKEEIHMKKE